MAVKADRRRADRRVRRVKVQVDRRNGDERRQADRRQAVRAPMDLWVEEAHGEDVYFRRVGNLSLGGVYFEQTIPHRVGTNITLKFSVPGHERIIEAKGEVVNTPGSKEGLGMGVRFLSMHAQDRELLQTYIEEVIQAPSDSA